MVKILYFSWIKHLIGKSSEEYSLQDNIATIHDLISQLRQLDNGYQKAFANIDSIKIAINQEFATIDHPIHDGDEIAFFPPVTGG